MLFLVIESDGSLEVAIHSRIPTSRRTQRAPDPSVEEYTIWAHYEIKVYAFFSLVA